MQPFDKQDTLVPDEIGRIDHFLDDLNGADANRSLWYNLQVLDQYGDVLKVRTGNEFPYLEETQINQLKAFMAARRAAIPEDLNFAEGNQVGRCTWRFRDGDGSTGSRSLSARVVELDPDGIAVKVHKFNSLPYLTSPQIQGALAFLTAQRDKAYTEIIS